MSVSYGFRLAGDVAKVIGDRDLDGMVGRVGHLSALGGPPVKVRVTGARRYEDPMLGPGVWITADAVASQPRSFRARLTRLDAEGRPVGEPVELGESTFEENL